MGSDPEINAHQYSQLILNMDTRLIKQGKERLGRLDTHMQKIKTDSYIKNQLKVN